MNLNQLTFSEYDLKEISSSSQANKLVFFIGAGFSKFSETELNKIPTWNELIDDLKDDLSLGSETDFLKIAQLYYLKHGQNSYVKKIKSTIKDLNPSHFHKKIFELNPHYIITTNWDDLIEKTAYDMGHAYDLVSSDMELAQSTLDRKIIKMHGDFRQSNFVFKEDDYLQYNQNFPLIENFIKGIFSTSTVVFLGYSYSDYNLKQIISWISNISKATPKKYLIQKKHDEAQSIYLKNHGISLLSPRNNNISYNDLYSMFFEDLNIIQNQNSYLIKLFNSSEHEIQKAIENTSASQIEKENFIKKITEYTSQKIVKSINEKITSLLQYNVLLPEQVSEKFSNCTIEYNNSEITLIAHQDILTSDYNESIRKINYIYFDNVLNEESEYEKNLISVLNKARINNVKFKDLIYSIESISNLDEMIIKKLNFSYPKDSLEILVINKEYTKILSTLIEKVKYNLKNKNYILTTICMANYDYICKMIDQYNLIRPSINDKKINKQSPFNYERKIIDFPRELQEDLNGLVNILEFNEIYKVYYRFDILSKKNQEYSTTRKNGGLAFSSDEFTLRSKLYPYVYFILGNEILFEEYSEIKKLFESNILSSIIHYITDSKFYLCSLDVFILIKYCDSSVLERLRIDLIRDKKIIKFNKIKRQEYKSIRIQLIQSMVNIFELQKNKNKGIFFTTSFDRWLKNSMILLSCAKFSRKQYEFIINYLRDRLQDNKFDLNSYNLVTDFININFQLHENSSSDILKILEALLSNIEPSEKCILTSNIPNDNLQKIISIISKRENFTFKNTSLLALTLTKIRLLETNEKINFTDNLLLYIREIGNYDIIEIIDNFLENEVITLPITSERSVILHLKIIDSDFNTPNDLIKKIELYIQNMFLEKNNNSELNRFLSRNEINETINFLINEKGMIQLKGCLDILNNNLN